MRNNSFQYGGRRAKIDSMRKYSAYVPQTAIDS